MQQNGLSPIIQFKDFSFTYASAQEPALKDINLDIYPGEKILILGASGSGKSTLGQCINGLIPNQFEGTITGTATVAGHAVGSSSVFDLSQEVGSVLQDSDAQFVGINVAEDIAFALENRNTPRSVMRAFVDKVARRAGVVDQLQSLPYSLSGGQKQKVSVAGILGEKNQILLFDEPLAALDPQMGLSMVELIDSLNKQDGKTVIIIEHRLEDVLHRPIDRVVLLDQGRIVTVMTPDELITSDLLIQYGIREPLYISALKNMYGGLKQKEGLTQLETIDLAPYQGKQSWRNDEGSAFKEAETSGQNSQSDSDQVIVHLEDLSFGYDPEQPLIQIPELTIKRGERIAIVGENGSGKSTLAKLLTGVLKPQSGSIERLGNPVTIQEIAQLIGYVMQNPNQMLVTDSVYREIALGLEYRQVDKAEIEDRVQQVLQVTGLYPKRNWPISALSYGQKKRLSVAIVLALEPTCIILDEPTAGSDYAHYREVMEFIDDLNQTYQMTMIFITHDMHLALEYTDRGLVIEDGHLIADRPIFDILADDQLVQRTSLKKTSIFDFAKRLNLPVADFVQAFIKSEREGK
ncbi:ABC transporter ATP-binding protein [Aerococcus urinae]